MAMERFQYISRKPLFFPSIFQQPIIFFNSQGCFQRHFGIAGSKAIIESENQKIIYSCELMIKKLYDKFFQIRTISVCILFLQKFFSHLSSSLVAGSQKCFYQHNFLQFANPPIGRYFRAKHRAFPLCLAHRRYNF